MRETSMPQIVEIVDRGRGPQLSTSRITVQDLLPCLQRNCSPEDIMKLMPGVTLAEIEVVRQYVRDNDAAVALPAMNAEDGSLETNGAIAHQSTSATQDAFPKINSAEWDAMNMRRAELIRKDIEHGLTAEEREEYERLQKMSLEAVLKACPQPMPDSEGLARLRNELLDASSRRSE